MAKILDETQTTFLIGRKFLSNVLVAIKSVYEVKRKKEKLLNHESGL